MITCFRSLTGGNLFLSRETSIIFMKAPIEGVANQRTGVAKGEAFIMQPVYLGHFQAFH